VISVFNLILFSLMASSKEELVIRTQKRLQSSFIALSSQDWGM
jgi:hypothetical protein